MEKLLPIISYSEKYYNKSVGNFSFFDAISTTVLKSVEQRISPDCPFTRFEGPGFENLKVTVLTPGFNGNLGEEAIFGKLPNYHYKISWKLENFDYINPPRFWTIDIVPGDPNNNRAFQLFDIHGNYSVLGSSEGCFIMYGYHFPVVLEMDPKYKITLTIKLGKYLGDNNNPFAAGKHCLKEYGFAYDNRINDQGLITRVMSDSLSDFSERVRERYYSIYREPCNKNMLRTAQETQIFSIDSNSTVKGYYGYSFITYCSTIMQIAISETLRPKYPILQVTGTIDTSSVIIGSCLQVLYDITVDIEVIVEIALTDVQNAEYKYCNTDYFLKFYHQKDNTEFIHIPPREIITNTIKYNSTISNINLRGGDIIYFGGYGFIMQKTYEGRYVYDYPESVTGNITIKG